MTMRVLVVEDNPSVASLLQRGLEREGYQVEVATTGREGLERGLAGSYGAIVLDIMIPEPDGLTVVRRLRQAGRWTPVLMLTARDRVEDRVAGLRAGADDYLGKPFSLREVTARLHALSRRASSEQPQVVQVGDLSLDPATRSASRNGVQVGLSSKEFDLLAELMRHPDETLTRGYLWEHVFGSETGLRPELVELYVERLRDKVDRRFGVDSIVAIPRQGYRLESSRSR